MGKVRMGNEGANDSENVSHTVFSRSINAVQNDVRREGFFFPLFLVFQAMPRDKAHLLNAVHTLGHKGFRLLRGVLGIKKHRMGQH